MKIISVTMLVLLILGISCTKETNPDDITQPVLFEYEYLNHAWIYTHFGWMIDSKGDLVGFQNPKHWVHPDNDGYISKDDLIANLNQQDTTFFSVDLYKALDYFEDRFDMLSTDLDTSDVYMADAGIGGLYVYVWDSNKELYKKQLLESSGDFSVRNTKPKVDGLVKWLSVQGEKTGRFFWFDR